MSATTSAPSLVLFSPSPTAPFQFQATLDGAIYIVVVTWNLAGQRWYVNISDLSGNRIVSLPLIGSPSSYAISLTAGYFATPLVYRIATTTFEIGP